MDFEVPPGGVSRAVWVDSISGDFLVVNNQSGVIRLYNAGQPSCKEIIKVSRHSILDIRRMTNDVYLIKLMNGQITQYNIKTRKTLFTTDVGHTHQIQKALMHPRHPNVMASVGFDGTLRKWNLKAMEMELMFQDRNAQGRDTVI